MALLSAFYPQPVVAGTTTGTYAAGDDSRITGAAQKVGVDDIEITSPSKGLILRDSDNTRRRIRVEDGIVLTEVVP